MGEGKASITKGDSCESPFCLLTAAVRVWAPIRQVDTAGGLSAVDHEGLHQLCLNSTEYLFLHQPNLRCINICKVTEIVATIPEYSFHKPGILG